MPFREANDRIAKYGPGFSKILSMLKPEQSIDSARMEPTVGRRKSTLEMEISIGQQ